MLSVSVPVRRRLGWSPLAILVEGDITINIQETAEPVSPDTALRLLAEQLGLEVGAVQRDFSSKRLF